jgi:serine/threonine-protein kinase RsbW
LSQPLRSELSTHLARIGAGERGFEAELTMAVPSRIAVVEEAVEIVARHLEAHFVDRHTIRFNLRVALSEALSNAIIYGNAEDPAKQVRVRVRFGRFAVEMEVADDGFGFRPDRVPDPTLPENLTRDDGRGLFLIRHLMDEVRFNERGNSICMILRRA